MTTPTSEPLVIVGSRLQALIFAVGAGAIGVGLWSRFGPLVLLVVIPLAVAAALTLHRRVELHPGHVAVRRRLRPTVLLDRDQLEASTGHRYLRLDGEGVAMRIEVPVEIRPEVRAWAADPPR